MSLTIKKKWSEPSGAPAGPDLGLKFSGNEHWNAIQEDGSPSADHYRCLRCQHCATQTWSGLRREI